MANLEPDIFFGQRAWRIANDVFKALQIIRHSSTIISRAITYLQTLVKLLLLLIYDSQPEVDLVGLLEIRRHAHHLRESLFRVI